MLKVGATTGLTVSSLFFFNHPNIVTFSKILINLKLTYLINRNQASVATYCWKKDAYCYQEFIDRQTRKGKLGGIESGKTRRKNSISEQKPWVDLGISRATYYRKLNKKPINI